MQVPLNGDKIFKCCDMQLSLCKCWWLVRNCVRCPAVVHRMHQMTKTAVKDSHFFINTEFAHHLPVLQLVSFLQQTHASSEQSPV